MKTLRHNLDILRVLALTDFKLRYHGSLLGYVWALLKPLLIFCVLYFVFQFMFGSNVEFYALRLLTAIILWSFFSEATMAGMHSLINRANLVTKLSMPRWIIPMASIATSTLSLFINIGILVVFFLANGKIPSLASLFISALLVILFAILAIGFSLMTAVLLPKFRDLGQIWEVLLNALMYATPIIYPLTAIPDKYHWLFYLNPLTQFFELIRSTLIDGILPMPQDVAPLATISILMLIGGIVVFSSLQKHIAQQL